MDPYSLAIPIGFILLATVLCMLLIDSRWGWKQKLALIVIVPAFGLGVWASIGSYKGWPTTTEMPKKVMVFWTLVREPDPKNGDKGAIFIWALPYYEEGEAKSLNPLDYAGPSGEPRAYKLKYSRPLHAGLEDAKPTMGQGEPVVLELGEEPPPSGESKSRSTGTEEAEPSEGVVAPREENPTVYPEQTTPREFQHGGSGAVSEEPAREFKLYKLPPSQAPRKNPEH